MTKFCFEAGFTHKLYNINKPITTIATFAVMKNDPLSVPLFEMRLEEIHRADPWLRYEISIRDFIALFPVKYKNGIPMKPEHPAIPGVDRDVFLKVLVAFSQCFN